MGVEASIVVKFEDDEDRDTSSIVVELDDLHGFNLDAEGKSKSSFNPDDTPVFLIHHPDDIEVVSVLCTDGIVEILNNYVYQPRTVDQLFTSIKSTNDVQYSNVSINSVEWYGNTGSIYMDDGNIGGVIKIGAATFPCFGTVTIQVEFQYQYRLIPPALDLQEDETYTIYVVIYVKDVI